MEKTITLIHEVTSYKERIKYYILILIGAISFLGVFCFLRGKTQNIALFLFAISIPLGILVVNKILKSRLYLADFISDSQNVK